MSKPAEADWISAKSWGEITRASNVAEAFELLPDHIAQNPEEWRHIFDAVSSK